MKKKRNGEINMGGRVVPPHKNVVTADNEVARKCKMMDDGWMDGWMDICYN